MYKPTRQSNAIGLGFLGFGILLTSYVLYRWQVGPYLDKKRRQQAQEWANYVFEEEQKEKLQEERFH